MWRFWLVKLGVSALVFLRFARQSIGTFMESYMRILFNYSKLLTNIHLKLTPQDKNQTGKYSSRPNNIYSSPLPSKKYWILFCDGECPLKIPPPAKLAPTGTAPYKRIPFVRLPSNFFIDSAVQWLRVAIFSAPIFTTKPPTLITNGQMWRQRGTPSRPPCMAAVKESDEFQRSRSQSATYDIVVFLYEFCDI